MNDTFDAIPNRTPTVIETRTIIYTRDTLVDGEWVRTYPDAPYRAATLNDDGSQFDVIEGTDLAKHLHNGERATAKAFADMIANKAKARV